MYVHSGFSTSRLPRGNCCTGRSVISDVAKPRCRPHHIVVTQCQLQQDGKLATTNVGMSTNIAWHEGAVSRTEKEQLLGQKGCILWFTGLSGSGKSTVACAVEQLLNERGHYTALLDGDNIRHGLCSNLGFTQDDRKENIRRIGEVAKIMAESGIVTITSFISPYRADRDSIRERLSPCDFLEIYMDVPISICEENLRACRNDLKSKSRLYTDISKERAVLEKFLGDCSREQSEERQKHVSSLNDLKSMVMNLFAYICT